MYGNMSTDYTDTHARAQRQRVQTGGGGGVEGRACVARPPRNCGGRYACFYRR
jgi:hypothetical protein